MRVLTTAGITIFWLVTIISNLSAQNISIPDTLKGWDQIWVTSLNGSEAMYSNWSQGGASSVSGAVSSVFKLLNRKNKRGFGVRLNLKYGQSYIKDGGVRKTDDQISLRSRLTKNFKEEDILAVFTSTWIQTQFDKGYKYNGGFGGRDSLISNFLSPIYFTESMGIAYTPKDYFTMEVGVGLKQTYIADDIITENYGLNPYENFRSEGGVSAGINLQKEIFSNIFYSGSLETFTNLLNGLKRTDISWSNELVGEINEVVNASFQFEMKYDEDFSSQVQLKQILSVGVSLNLY